MTVSRARARQCLALNALRSNGNYLTPNQGTDQLDQEVDTNELIKEVDSFANDLN